MPNSTIAKYPSPLGCLEHVQLPNLGCGGTLAKIDTGAFSGAMHCTGIRVVRRGKDKRRILKFHPLGDANLAAETSDFKETYIRSTTGHRVKRYIITTNIIVGGETYPVTIGIADRSSMKRKLLLGRRFLRENGLVVDVRINEELDDEGENTL